MRQWHNETTESPSRRHPGAGEGEPALTLLDRILHLLGYFCLLWFCVVVYATVFVWAWRGWADLAAGVVLAFVLGAAAWACFEEEK